MASNENLQLFEEQPIRTAWNEEEEEWYFSIVDVVGVLTDQPDVRRASTYWAVLKNRLNEEGANELLTNCKQLKLKATDGKRRLTDVANTEQLLRLIQSIPSKKAEPFKRWLAQVGRERIEETLDPELIAERLVATYERKGYLMGHSDISVTMNTYTHLGLEDAVDEMNRMQQLESARKEQEALSGKTERNGFRSIPGSKPKRVLSLFCCF